MILSKPTKNLAHIISKTLVFTSFTFFKKSPVLDDKVSVNFVIVEGFSRSDNVS